MNNKKINDPKVVSAKVDGTTVDDRKLDDTKENNPINSTILKIINNIYCLYFIDYIYESYS